MGAGSGLALTAAVVGALLIASPTPTVSDPSTSAGTTSTGSAPTGVRLVSYTGAQPVGYTLDRVPEGWDVESSGRSSLTLAPHGAGDDTDPSEGQPDSLIGKIDVSQERAVPTGVTKDDIEVDGRPGVIAHMLGADGTPDGTLTLFLRQPSGNYLTIQVWSGIGWGNDQIAEFAAGVHVTKDASVTAG